jgi:hypothetical protein
MERSLMRRSSGVQGVRGVQGGKTRESEWERVGVSAYRRVGVSACRRVLRRSTIFIAIGVQIA